MVEVSSTIQTTRRPSMSGDLRCAAAFCAFAAHARQRVDGAAVRVHDRRRDRVCQGQATDGVVGSNVAAEWAFDPAGDAS